MNILCELALSSCMSAVTSPNNNNKNVTLTVENRVLVTALLSVICFCGGHIEYFSVNSGMFILQICLKDFAVNFVFK